MSIRLFRPRLRSRVQGGAQAYKFDYSNEYSWLHQLIRGKWDSQRFDTHEENLINHRSITNKQFAYAACKAALATWWQEFDRSYPKVPVLFADGWCHVGWHSWQLDRMSGYEIQYYDDGQGHLKIFLDCGIDLEQIFVAHRLKEVHEAVLTGLYGKSQREARSIAKQEWRLAYA